MELSRTCEPVERRSVREELEDAFLNVDEPEDEWFQRFEVAAR